jgi:hypothetical protein
MTFPKDLFPNAQNAANGIALRTRDDMLRLDAMIMTVQLGIRKLLEVALPCDTLNHAAWQTLMPAA